MRLIKIIGLLLVCMVSGFGVSIQPDDYLASNYSIYAKRNLQFKFSAETAKSGWLGSGGTFKQSGWDKVIYHSEIRVTGSFDKGAGAKVYEDSIYVKGTVTGTMNVPLISSTKDFVEPSFNSSDYPAKADITVDLGNNLIKTSGGETVLAPGVYGNVANQSTGTIVLTAGDYSFNSLEMRGTFIVRKGPFETTRIMVREELKIQNYAATKNNQLIEEKGNYGKVLLYFAGTNNTIDDDTRIDATIFAPRARLNLSSGLQIFGQVFADEIIIENGFDGATGEFVPLVQSNVTITPPEELLEDTTVVKGSTQTPHVDNSYDTTIICSLATITPNEAGKELSIAYKITDGTATAGSDYVVASSSARFTFGPSEQCDTISITIKDDSDSEGSETFNIKFNDVQSTFSNYNINLGSDTVHTITIIDDDSNNSPPTGITLSNKSINEEITPNGFVGLLTGVDPDGNTTADSFSVASGFFTVSNDSLFATNSS